MAKPDLERLAVGQVGQARRYPAMLEAGLSYGLLYWAFFSGGGALLPLLASGGAAGVTEEDAAWLRLLNIPMVVLVPIVVATKVREIATALARNPILLALLLLATISLAWSVNPEVTTRRLVTLWTMTLLAIYCAIRFTPEQLIRHGTNFFLAALVASVLMAVAVPYLGFMEGTRFRGIFVHKNAFGAVYQIGWVFFLLSWRFGLLRARVALSALGVTFVALILADSATALGLCVLATLAFYGLGWVKLPPALGGAMVAMALAVGAIACLALILEPSWLFLLLGRDADLTGRVPLWRFLWGMIELRPWTGYGYQAFFSVPEYTKHLLDALTWEIPHSHSGYVESLLGLGVFGLVLASMLMIDTLARGFRLLRRGDLLLANFVILQLLCIIGRNFSESDMMQHQSLLWFVWIAGTVAAGSLLAAPISAPAREASASEPRNRRQTDNVAWTPRPTQPPASMGGRPILRPGRPRQVAAHPDRSARDVASDQNEPAL